MGFRAAAPLLIAATLVASVACGGDDADDDRLDATTSTAPVIDPDPGAADLASIELSTTLVAELDQPISLAVRPGGGDLYVAEKTGAVRRILVAPADGPSDDRYSVQERPVVDLSGEVADGGEQGLLGIAFSSDGRQLYLDYTRAGDGATVVEAVELGDGAGADEPERRELLVVDQPAPNHNGGQLVLGPDGYLYVGLGDGGGGGDPDGHGQDIDTLLGSILRIDPQSGERAADGDDAYIVPTGNPFHRDGRPSEVWLYGVRNPWRFTFDRTTGDLWVADVGQGSWEEINVLPATEGRDAGRGSNLGWNEMEGRHPYEGGENPDGAILPVLEYDHSGGGCSVTGGYRYRGAAIPALDGVYLFADYCLAGVQGIQLDASGRAVAAQRAWDLPSDRVQSFGEDDDGELYLLLAGGDVRKIVAR